MHPMRVVTAIAQIVRLFSLTLLVPIPFAFLYPANEPIALLFGLAVPLNALVFLTTFAIATLLWVPVVMASRRYTHMDDLQDREGYLVVALAWVVLAVIGMIPFLLSRVLVHPVDAFFESMSGITTTGATVIYLHALEDVPRSVMLWRAILQYVGGGGIVVLVVALLARLSHGGMQLLRAEVTGPTVTRLQPKLAQTAKTLWGLYGVLSFAAFAGLLLLFVIRGLAPLDAFYDAFYHMLTSISTGGFSNHTTSIAYYDWWAIELFLIVVMLVGATNFTLWVRASRGDWRSLWRDSEWRFYMLLFAGATIGVTGLLWHAGHGLMQGLRGAAFTVASLVSSTGYATVDYAAWPDGAKLLVFVLMLTGGSAGSTSGALKVVRVVILMKVVQRALRKLLHPRAVIPIRLGRKVLTDETVWTVVAFFFTYLTLWLAGSLIITALDPALGLVDGAAAAGTAISNFGPGLGIVGPTAHFGMLLPSTKMILTFLMWAGRLELFAVLLVFTRSAWKN